METTSFHLLDVAVCNSCILYIQSTQDKKLTRLWKLLNPVLLLLPLSSFFFANTYNLGFEVYVPSSQEIFAENRIVHLS